jgi:hypothetical protein
VLIQRLSIFAQVAGALDLRVVLGQHRTPRQVVADLRLFDRVAVKMSDILRDDSAAGVGPGPGADAIAGVHRVGTLRAEIGAPGPAGSGRDLGGGGELCAVSVGSGEATEISAITDGGAGHEERHRFLRSAGAALRRRCGRILCGG